MSATDELRHMLDELRKLACDINEEEIRSHSVITLNQGRYNRQFRLDMNHDWLNAWHAELERILQAIAATLGTGTCKLDGYTDAAFRVVQEPDETDFIDYAEVCECTACGASVIVPHEYERISCERDELWPTYNFCPHCGAKVIAPTTNNVDVEVSDG